MDYLDRYKTSIFVHEDGDRVFNDLTDCRYELDPVETRILHGLAEPPGTLETLSERMPEDDVCLRLQTLVERRLVVPSEMDETRSFVAHRVDVETCRHCNARCCYCPQSVAPKPSGVMPQKIFDMVLSRLTPHSPQWVALNHFGEPLMDPFFVARVTALRDRGLLLRLFTNATLLSDALVGFLCEGGLHGLVFNFPSLAPAEWSRLMCLPESRYWAARRAMETVLQAACCPVTIAVNANTADQAERARRVQEHFSAFGCFRLNTVLSSSRAGLLRNEMVLHTEQPPATRYAGCARIAAHVHVSWEGKVYLCCQDYHQRQILGDLCREDLSTIMASPRVARWRAEIYGLEAMRSDRICLECPMLRRRRFQGMEDS